MMHWRMDEVGLRWIIRIHDDSTGSTVMLMFNSFRTMRQLVAALDEAAGKEEAKQCPLPEAFTKVFPERF